jgi:hypothetical protein
MGKIIHGHFIGDKPSKTYKVWQGMLNRNTYKIKPEVCPEWFDFTNFLADMGERPVNMTLDRVDNSKGYFKSNCRWVTMKTQQNNRTNNLVVLFRGECRTAAQIRDILNLPLTKVHKWIHACKDIEKAYSSYLNDKRTPRERKVV